jgi:predicted AlkP superfamily phosphohydrolase/phosphomutase
VPDGPTFNPYRALIPAGLSKLSGKREVIKMADGLAAFSEDVESTQEGSGVIEETKVLGQKPDIKNCKAVPLQTSYIYVNLKGRDPDGIVDPKDYAKVQQEIIDALYTYVDPRTGTRPVALALTKEDARLLGLHGDDCGDVVYAVYPNYGMQHGNILPTAEWGVGSLRGFLVFYGPNIKKGLRLSRTCGLTDVVPTICYLLKWPVPAETEGCVLYQAFKDPNFIAADFDKMQAALARMENALQRGERQPWDKHECA